MMTVEMMTAMLEALEEDALYSYDEDDAMFYVDLNDFEGFDDDWSEVMRDYTHPELVAQFEEMLEEQCLSQEGDFYVVYHFEGFSVHLGYTSFDI